ncbi:family 1 glycosylhydrolase [Pedobacter sp.]|uniref:family 1 glycosylhydrolase n=1 Tax=Pedobacter sp. TaxID=1411316 RepID=UPI003D7F89DA
MELWGGIECTINRVGDQYFNQLVYQGHYDRKNDLKLLEELGIKKLRYPILWEYHQPEQHQPLQWGVIEKNLLELKERKIEVIAGLVHHGSGPAYVNLMDQSFAEGLAAYATEVARRFPWINYYTPINEPLTTARFCGLYGLWYPHECNAVSFLRILYNECKATLLAMEAIRKVNPNAKLVHTEDLGKIHSTRHMQYQADFENERRWIGIDLLSGRMDSSHPLWRYCIDNGLTEEELQFFTAHAMPPDILGFNYYVTSERYLDEHTEYYPVQTHGGNGKEVYADVEAVRTREAKMDGLTNLLRDAWNRLHLPLAVTECHLFCGREDQMRWVKSNWDAVANLQKEEIVVEAFTIWSIFGAYGWDRLLTHPHGNYENGVFDVRSLEPRPTALKKLVKSLAVGAAYEHPLLSGKGWWERESRIIYPKAIIETAFKPEITSPLIIVGATGTLGKAFTKICQQRNIFHIALTRAELNMVNPAQIAETIEKYKPWAIINAAGFVRVDDAEIQFEDCFQSNTEGPVKLAKACQQYGVKLLTFSSDLVFDGEKKEAYTEEDAVNPLNVYGASKAIAEQEVLANDPNALVIRTSAFFSPWDNYNFVYSILDFLGKKERVKVADDVVVSPTYVPDLVNASLDLLIDDANGIWHLVNDGTVSWSELAKEVAIRGNYNASLLEPLPVAELGYPAVRPNYSALTSRHGLILPSLDHALNRYFSERNAS